ncbi:hypothetical protein [Thalassotalea agariperforans]
MLSSLILALGLSTSPAEASPVEVAVSPLNSIEQTGRSLGKTRIALESELAGRSLGKTRIALESELTGRSLGKTRIALESELTGRSLGKTRI